MTRHSRGKKRDGKLVGEQDGERDGERDMHRSKYSVYRATLRHRRDDSIDLELYASRDDTEHRSTVEGFARLLGLPVLAALGDGHYEERATGDLDKSVVEQIAQGSLRRPAAPTVPLQSTRVRTLQHADGVTFERNIRTSALITGTLMLAFSAAFSYWTFGIGRNGGQGDFWVVPIIAIVTGLIGFVSLAVGPFVRITLSADPRRVCMTFTIGGYAATQQTLEAHLIEEIRVIPKTGVSVISDQATLEFGAGLSESELEHVRAAILATLARGTVRSGPAMEPETENQPTLVDDAPSEKIERLREYAIDRLAAGATPQSVYTKLCSLGAPALDVSASLRAIATDPGDAHAEAVGKFLASREPGV